MADQEKDLRRRATILNEIEDRQKRIQALVERGAVSQELLNKFTVIQEEKIKKAGDELKKLNAERLRGAKQAEIENSNLGSLYQNLSKFVIEILQN